MTLIAEIVELTNQAYKIWSTKRGEYTLSPQELYTKFIEPSYKLLKEIHSDYLELYLELQERIVLEKSLSSETVRWFSKARSSRQMDRSELKLLEIPRLNRKLIRGVSGEYLVDLNQAVGSYLANLRDYFLPEQGLRVSLVHRLFETNADQILSTRIETRSFHTETWLSRMYLWLELPNEEKMALLADEYLRTQLEQSATPLVRDDIIEGILQIVTQENTVLLSKLEQLLIARSDSVKDRIHSRSKDEQIPHEVKKDIDFYLDHLAETPNWRRIIEDHIWTERKNMEEAIGRVQHSFIQVRILADR